MSSRVDVHQLAQRMTEERYAKLDLEDAKLKAIKLKLFEQAKASGFDSIQEYIAELESRQPNLQPIIEESAEEVPPSNHWFYVAKSLGQKEKPIQLKIVGGRLD